MLERERGRKLGWERAIKGDTERVSKRESERASKGEKERFIKEEREREKSNEGEREGGREAHCSKVPGKSTSSASVWSRRGHWSGRRGSNIAHHTPPQRAFTCGL